MKFTKFQVSLNNYSKSYETKNLPKSRTPGAARNRITRTDHHQEASPSRLCNLTFFFLNLNVFFI